MSQLPEYVSHKKVRAAKIVGITWKEDYDFGGVTILHLRRPYPTVEVDQAYCEKHLPALVQEGLIEPYIGGYFVVYEDGHRSWSPAKTFEEGYTKL